MALLPGGRGDFIVTADDRVLWHKREMGGEFPEEREILRRLSA
ncbi:MAG: Rdx family protein [Sandaracinaceae bacterium]